MYLNKTLSVAAVIAISLAVSGCKSEDVAALPKSQKTYRHAVAEVGCKSPYSETKRDDIWKRDYNNHVVRWTGTVFSAEKTSIQVKVDALSYDFAVDLAKGETGYDLVKGQHVAVEFVLKQQGGCFVPFSGKHGKLLRSEV